MPLAEIQNIFFIPLPGSGKGSSDTARSVDNGSFNEPVFIGDSANEPLRNLFESGWSSGESAWPGFCSPFVLYGPSGCGKSSLAVALASQFASAGRRPLFWTGPDLVRHVAAAIDSQTVDQLLSQLELAAAVCVDDLYWLEKHDAAQEFMIAAIDRLQEREVPVVVTLPDSPANMKGLRPTLISRLSGGLTIPVSLPGMAVRCEILAKLFEQHDLPVDASIIETLANRFPVSARLLGRIANTLAARYQGLGLSDSTDEEVVALIVKSACDHPDFSRKLVEMVAAEIGVGARDIYGTSRQQSIVLARGIVTYLLRNSAAWNFSRIGRLLRGKDHSTILHASRKIAARVENDLPFAGMIRKLQASTGDLIALCLPESAASLAVAGIGKPVDSLLMDVD